MLLGFVERQSQLTSSRRYQAGAAVTQVVIVVVVRRNVISIVVFGRTPAVLGADVASRGRRVFQLLVRLDTPTTVVGI